MASWPVDQESDKMKKLIAESEFLQAYSEGKIGPRETMHGIGFCSLRDLLNAMVDCCSRLPRGRGREEQVEREVAQAQHMLAKALGTSLPTAAATVTTSQEASCNAKAPDPGFWLLLLLAMGANRPSVCITAAKRHRHHVPCHRRTARSAIQAGSCAFEPRFKTFRASHRWRSCSLAGT